MASSSGSNASSGGRSARRPPRDLSSQSHPSSSSPSRQATACTLSLFPLTLAELEPFTRAGHAVLLAFLGARIAREQPRLAQPRPQFRVELEQGPRDTEAQRAGLTVDAAAARRRED